VWCLLSFGYRNAFDATSIMLSLNAYFDKCLEIIATFNDFTIQHVSRDENTVVNDLAQEASGFQSNQKNVCSRKTKCSDWPFWMFQFVVNAQC
jgi:Mlc titration factor MtfA (ptsG expression regulator)